MPTRKAVRRPVGPSSRGPPDNPKAEMSLAGVLGLKHAPASSGRLVSSIRTIVRLFKFNRGSAEMKSWW
jgi:hypothetical protein